eukprot:s698_g8.t1
MDSVFSWDIEENVNEAMDVIDGTLQEEYDQIANSQVTVNSKTWTDRLKTVGNNLGKEVLKAGAKTLAKTLCPECGFVASLVSGIIDVFWPSSWKNSGYDIWELIVGQVQKLVDISLLKQELRDRYADLLAVKRDLKRFCKSKTVIDRGNVLSIALAKVEDVMAHLTESANSIQFIPLSVTIATLHCAILRIRIVSGTSLYGSYDPSWEGELQGAVAFYQSYFDYMYGEWYSWREGQISTSSDARRRSFRRRTSCDAYVNDELTGDEYHVEVHNGQDYYNHGTKEFCGTSVVGWQKSHMIREYARSMVASLQPVMMLQRFIQGMESAPVQVLPAIEYVTLGPYAPYTQFISDVVYRGSFVEDPGRPCTSKDSFGGPGTITEVHFRSGSEVDWLDIHYEEGQECYAGNLNGGDAGEIQEFQNKYISGITKMCFNDYVMTHMSLTLSDGEEVNLGTGECEVYSNGDITSDATYRLVGTSLYAGRSSLVHIEQNYKFVGMNISDSNTEFFPSNMKSGDMLNTNTCLESPNQVYKFFVQKDANLVIYDTFGDVMWARNKLAPNDCDDPSTLQLQLQNDGDLVLWCGETALWRSQTGTPNDICRVVALRNDGQLAMYNVRDQLGVWSSTGQVPLGLGPTNLTSPRSLTLGQSLVQTFYGAGKSFELSIQNGKAMLKRWPSTTIWTAGNGCDATDYSVHLELQEDGNLVLYCDASNTNSPWATNTTDKSLENLKGSNVLFLTVDGNMELVNKRGQTTWTSGTAEAYTYFPPSEE